MKYIVAFDLTDPAVKEAAQTLSQMYPEAIIVDANQAEDWPTASPDSTLYLIDHGSGQTFGGYNDPAQLVRENGRLQQPFQNAASVVLVSCSTAQEAGLILQDGFQASTFARNLSGAFPQKEVQAAVGPVYADGMGNLRVETPGGIEGVTSDDEWVAFEGGNQKDLAASPFER